MRGRRRRQTKERDSWSESQDHLLVYLGVSPVKWSSRIPTLLRISICRPSLLSGQSPWQSQICALWSRCSSSQKDIIIMTNCLESRLSLSQNSSARRTKFCTVKRQLTLNISIKSQKLVVRDLRIAVRFSILLRDQEWTGYREKIFSRQQKRWKFELQLYEKTLVEKEAELALLEQ